MIWRIWTMTFHFDYFDNKPAMLKIKDVAEILFGDARPSNCQRIRNLVKKGQFPEPTIPASNGRGCVLWTTPVVQKWYMEQAYEKNNSVDGSSLNTD